MSITKQICYLGMLEKLFVNSYICLRLRSLREAIILQVESKTFQQEMIFFFKFQKFVGIDRTLTCPLSKRIVMMLKGC